MQHQQAGAVFHRCALQVNPHHYRGTFRGDNSDGDAQSYADGIVRKAAEIGVAALAITDHNNASSVWRRSRGRRLITTLRFSLALSYPRRKGFTYFASIRRKPRRMQIGRFLGHFDIQRLEPSADLSTKDFAEIINDVQGQGGIAVSLPTSRDDNGLFKESKGRAENPGLAESKTCLQFRFPVRLTILNITVTVKLSIEQEPRLSPFLESWPPSTPRTSRRVEDLDSPSATCWIKMSEVSVDGFAPSVP